MADERPTIEMALGVFGEMAAFNNWTPEEWEALKRGMITGYDSAVVMGMESTREEAEMPEEVREALATLVKHLFA